jgi:hypothetical protein
VKSFCFGTATSLRFTTYILFETEAVNYVLAYFNAYFKLSCLTFLAVLKLLKMRAIFVTTFAFLFCCGYI